MQFLFVAHVADAGELQWRRGRTPAANAVADANSKFRDAAVRPAAADGVLGDNYSNNSNSGPGLSNATAGQAAGQTAGQGQATLRSVIVTRDNDSNPALRSAQLPPPTQEPNMMPGGGTAPTPQPSRSQLLENLQKTFESQPDTRRDLGTPDMTRQPGADLSTPPAQIPAGPGSSRPGFQDFPPVGGLTMPQTDQDQTTPRGELNPQAVAAEERRTKEVCSEQLNALKTSTLAVVKLDISVTGTPGRDHPFECSIDDGTWHPGRCWPGTTYMWKASALCHKPLYFEDEQMERYGHSWGPCCDTLVSGAHFFCKLPVLPYCMGLTPPCECVYALGHYRPGSCAPNQLDPIPLSWRAGLIQAGAVVGTAAILP